MTTRRTVIIEGPEDRNLITSWAQKVDAGTIVEFRKKTRSNEQNAKLHAMLNEVAEQVVWYGSRLKVEDWKNIFTASLRKAQVVPGIDPGTVVPLGIHTSTMTIEEMSNMIELIYAFGADPDHPVVFKEPQQNTNPADEPSPASSAVSADDAPTSAEDGEAHPPSSSSTLSEADWLVVAARMLWAATPQKPTEESPFVLNNQRKAVAALMPEDASQDARDKAGSIYIRCKECLLGDHSRGDTLRYIANMAGVDVSELEAAP